MSLLILVSGCAPSSSASRREQNSENQINILCTTSHVASLVEAIAGPRATTKVLIRGESDPHSYQLVKGDDSKFYTAEVIFYSGLGLEHSPSLMRMMENKEKISVGDAIRSIKPHAVLYSADIPDPHIWMDISLWKLAIPAIRDKLSSLRPEWAHEFTERAERFDSKLADVDQIIKKIFKSISPEQRYLITTHDAFQYFARAYLATDEERAENLWTLRCFAPEGLAPEAQISTKDIENTVNHIIQYGVHWIFAESNVSQDSIRRVIEVLKRKGHHVEIAKDVLYADAMGESGSQGATYEGMMLYNAEIISRYMLLNNSNKEIPNEK